MMAGSQSQGVQLLRTLYRELRPIVNDPQKHVYQTQLWKYIVGLCRNCNNQPPAKVDEARKNLEQTGISYVLYLQSTRDYHRISDDYKGAGERSADDTAKLLGFKMPHEPKDPPKKPSKPSQSSSQSSQTPSEPGLPSNESKKSKHRKTDASL